MAADDERIEEEFDEAGQNLTQQRFESSDAPADASWDEDDWGDTADLEDAEEQEREGFETL